MTHLYTIVWCFYMEPLTSYYRRDSQEQASAFFYLQVSWKLGKRMVPADCSELNPLPTEQYYNHIRRTRLMGWIKAGLVAVAVSSCSRVQYLATQIEDTNYRTYNVQFRFVAFGRSFPARSRVFAHPLSPGHCLGSPETRTWRPTSFFLPICSILTARHRWWNQVVRCLFSTGHFFLVSEKAL